MTPNILPHKKSITARHCTRPKQAVERITQAVAREVAQGRLDETLYESPAGPIAAIDILWGHRASINRGNYHMAHKTGFTLKTLEKNLAHANFQKIEVKSFSWNLWLTAYKLGSNG